MFKSNIVVSFGIDFGFAVYELANLKGGFVADIRDFHLTNYAQLPPEQVN